MEKLITEPPYKYLFSFEGRCMPEAACLTWPMTETETSQNPRLLALQWCRFGFDDLDTYRMSPEAPPVYLM